MKTYNTKIFFISIVTGCLLFSCEPRIDFDMGQWGDNAFITDVLLFTLQEEEHQLQEYYENEETTTGIRRQFVNTTSAIDNDAAIVSVSVPAATDLTNVGLIIRHTAEKIEPLDGAPAAGYLDDFSSGSYKYRLTSADNTVRDWTININTD